MTQRELLEAKRDASVGDPPAVRLRLADGSLYKEKGKLDFIDITVDPKTDGQIVRAMFDNQGRPADRRPDGARHHRGEQARRRRGGAAAAVALDQTGPYVFIVDDKNVVQLQRFKTGIVRNGLLVGTEGLKAGDRVVVQGQQRIRDGMTVAPSRGTRSRQAEAVAP